MGVHVVEDALEALVGRLLVLQLAQLHGANLLEHRGVAGYEVAHLYESAHDPDAGLGCDVAFQDAREHGDAHFRVYEWQVCSTYLRFAALTS